MLRSIVFGVCVVTVACGGSGVGKPVAEFPSKAALESVAARKAQPKAQLSTLSVASFTMSGPGVAANSTYANENLWDQAFSARASERHSRAHLAPELRCAAKEMARFYTEYGAYPDESLRDFVLGHCGSSLPSAAVQTLTLEVPDSVADSQVYSQVAASSQQLFDQVLGRVGEDVGLGAARAKGRLALVAFAPALADGLRARNQ